MNWASLAAVPGIRVTHLKKAAAYYESKIGFSIDSGGEGGGTMGLSRGHSSMYLTNDAFREHYRNAGLVLVWLNLDSKEQVNVLYGLWSTSKAKIVSPPESKLWGLHEFTVADLDG